MPDPQNYIYIYIYINWCGIGWGDNLGYPNWGPNWGTYWGPPYFHNASEISIKINFDTTLGLTGNRQAKKEFLAKIFWAIFGYFSNGPLPRPLKWDAMSAHVHHEASWNKSLTRDVKFEYRACVISTDEH